MTRRERLERKLERRREWAEKRDAKAAGLQAQNAPFRGDWAFATQPGHIPERARANRRDGRAYEHAKMADYHSSKVAGLERQLDRAIFSDDDNAIEALEARIKANEAKRDRMKKINRLYRKGDRDGLAELGIPYDTLKAQIERTRASAPWVKTPYESYELTNLGARIRADKKRLETIQRQASKTKRAYDAGGVLIERIEGYMGAVYAVVTFAEKPPQETLDALKAAGYRWGAGHWTGDYANLPETLKGHVT
jgi:hypothetical protein